MKKLNSLFIILTLSQLGFSQFPLGSYLRFKGDDLNIEFLKDNKAYFIMGKDTLGNNLEINPLIIEYSLKNSESPKKLDFHIINSENNDTVQRVYCIYEYDSNSVLKISMHNKYYPTDFRSKRRTSYLILDNEDTYIQKLIINQEYVINNFNPEIKETNINDTTIETTYLNKGKVINTPLFQSYEVTKYSNNGRVISKEFYTSEKNEFLKDGKVFKTTWKYNQNDSITEIARFKNKDELIICDETTYPKVNFFYNNENKLDSVVYLINNKELEKTAIKKFEVLYNKYGEMINRKGYLSNGTPIVDEIDIKLFTYLKKWLKRYVLHPSSLNIITYSETRPSYGKSSGVKIKGSEKHEIYFEFDLNNKSNKTQRFEGFIQFNSKYEIINLSYLKEGESTYFNKSYSTSDMEKFLSIYGKKISLKEKENLLKKSVEDIDKYLKNK